MTTQPGLVLDPSNELKFRGKLKVSFKPNIDHLKPILTLLFNRSI
jgi:hypothetical protein